MKMHERVSKLSELLTEDEIKALGKSFDTVGDIMILEFRNPELAKKKKQIGEFMLNNYKNINVVAARAGMHEGIYRTQKLEILAGENRKETVHNESKARIMLDVENVYFSPRLSTERLRIAQQIKDGEKVLVMFSGAAPYVCVIAKNSKPEEIYGIEINPVAHDYALKNIKLNKISNARLFLGDARVVVPKIKEESKKYSKKKSSEINFDRIIMPLPKQAEDFLDVALTVSKKGTIIHLYQFLKKEEIPDLAFSRIQEACKKTKKKYQIISYRKCGQFSPSTFRVVVDFEIL